ncbi:hypothetical protein [Nocardia huaxiensis]|uniref:Uncharacterized protein n=1 Tax=Nocardia huaxiensis TaxID=2755382 RepID=A0A7D6VDR9_9NOCA|nr:hypothetical protein [Nocardia huaxiensis]QLY32102.1 hypothetical protein H0264_07380 [Nocardia huaxiensis]UFS95681.1 hypothetical protein LPY97_34260 [Nocardia huaxiensis]
MSAPIRRGGNGRTRDEYRGPQIHCARWRNQCVLGDLHAAVVGDGAAVARVLPAVTARARKVTVFQQDPIWVLPVPPIPGVRGLLDLLPPDLLGPLPVGTARPLPGDPVPAAPEHPPGVAALQWLAGAVLRRAAAANLRLQVRDSWHRRQLTPDTAASLRLHNHYYEALRAPNCRLVTWPIARLAPLGIRTVDGVEHRVDCIIYAEDTP